MKRKFISLILVLTLIISIFLSVNSFANKKGLNVTRIKGSDRYLTSVEVSKTIFDKSKYVIVASGEGFADALVGGTLAAQINAPILLVSKNSVSKEVINEIKRAKAKKIFVLGGTNTISDSVMSQIEALGLEVERLKGADRVETAIAIAEARFDLLESETMGDLIALINGFNFADALSAAPFVGQLENDGILTYLYPYADNSHADMVFGGINSVPSVGERVRFPGSNRYATAVEVAKGYKIHLKKDIDTIILVDGTNYPDALASAPVASMKNGAVLLTSPKVLSIETKNYIKDNPNIKNIIIIGGTNSVSTEIENLLKAGL